MSWPGGLHSTGMHDWILLEMELGARVAHAQDSEDCGWSALLDLSYIEYCERELAGMNDIELLEYMGTDPQRWAQEFMRTKGEIEARGDVLDEGTMLGWLANAMYSQHRSEPAERAKSVAAVAQALR